MEMAEQNNVTGSINAEPYEGQDVPMEETDHGENFIPSNNLIFLDLTTTCQNDEISSINFEKIKLWLLIHEEYLIGMFITIS